MAEFLIKAQEPYRPVLNEEGLATIAQKYDICEAAADGKHWAIKEYLPNFLVVKIPGLALEYALEYIKPLTGTIIIDGQEQEKTIIMFRYYFNFDEVGISLQDVEASDFTEIIINESNIKDKSL